MAHGESMAALILERWYETVLRDTRKGLRPGAPIVTQLLMVSEQA